MSVETTTVPTGARALTSAQIALGLVGAAVVLTVMQYVGVLPSWLHRLPEAVIPSFAVWLDALFNFAKDDLGLLAFTRFLTEELEWMLDFSANIFFGKRRFPNIGPMPWTALTGQSKIVMQTMSVLAIAAPLAFAIGLSLGIAAWKYPWVDRVIKPVLSALQTLPFFNYLLPAVIFFKVGPTAGAVATTIYAIPPMILMTTLGLKKVSPEVVEAGKMSGSTKGQMLRHVYIPSARTEILVGVNQVIMLCLAMVVLTAFIGMPGLGAKLLAKMGSFKLGRSFEIGVTIVLLAVMLDRMSKAWVVEQPEHFERGTPVWKRHSMLLLGAALFAGFTLLSLIVPFFSEVGRGQDFSQGKELDNLIKGFLNIDWVKATTGFLRAFLNVQVLIPFRN